MGNYSLLELSHDYSIPGTGPEALAWVRSMRLYAGSGDEKDLPQGMRKVSIDHAPIKERVTIGPVPSRR